MSKKVSWPINTQRMAIIVVDMQKVFCVESEPLYVPCTKDIITPIEKLNECARDQNIPVIYLRHIVRGDGSDTGRFKDLYPDADTQFARSSKGVEIIDSLFPQKQDIVIDKLFYSGFHNTDLDAILRAKDIDTLVVCGTVTNVCCETTIRDGVHREYKMIALEDAMAAMPYPDMGYGEVSAEEVQKISLSTIAYEFGEVATTKEIINRIIS